MARTTFTEVLTAVCVVAALLMGPAVVPAEATHARYANYSWRPTGALNQIEFTLQNAFRRTANPCVDTAALVTIACTGVDGFPVPGDVILESQGLTRFSPDGITIIGSPMGALMYRVTSIDPVNDWLVGVALDPSSLPGVDTTISHTYAAPGDYVAFTDRCCRISAVSALNEHLNNPDGGYRFETLVNVGTHGTNRSPVSSVPVMVLCPINAVCLFPISAVDPDGDTLHFRLSTAAEASSSAPVVNSHGTLCGALFCQPGPPSAANTAAVNAATGVYSWDTTGAQLATSQPNTLYSTQVVIEDLGALGNVKSKVVVDFLIQLVPVVGVRPAFDVPPTPQCGTTLNGVVGQELTFTVQASDPDGVDVVTLNVVGLPIGAVMAPALPTTGNPVSSVFTWTPGTPGVFVMTFTAADQTRQQATCAVTIDIVAGITDGFMTGGGGLTDNNNRVRHGFTLDCDVAGTGGNLQVNWGRGSFFHLETLTSAVCTTDASIDNGNPMAGFNTYHGTGTGRLNGGGTAIASWTLTDAGEPGGSDSFSITIMDGVNVVLSVSGTLEQGNHQAH